MSEAQHGLRLKPGNTERYAKNWEATSDMMSARKGGSEEEISEPKTTD